MKIGMWWFQTSIYRVKEPLKMIYERLFVPITEEIEKWVFGCPGGRCNASSEFTMYKNIIIIFGQKPVRILA